MSKYKLVNEDHYGKWINKPNNMGDIGDFSDITEELNRLLSERDEARQQNAKLRDIAERAISAIPNTEGYGGYVYSAAVLRAELDQLKEITK